jgi:S1-C subfamily serine protease
MNVWKIFTLHPALALAILMLGAPMVQAGPPGRGFGGIRPPRPVRIPYQVFRPRAQSPARPRVDSLRNRMSDPRNAQTNGRPRNQGNDSSQGDGGGRGQEGSDGSNNGGENGTDTAQPAQGRYLGVTQQAVIDPDGRAGIQVMSVTPGSPAHLAGLEPGDIVLSANGYVTQDVGTLPWLVNSSEPNGTLSLTVRNVRNGELVGVTAQIP